MTIATVRTNPVDTQPLLLDISDTTLTVTPEQFDLLCINNPDLRLELTPNLELIVMAPAGGESSEKNGDLSGQIWYWNRQTNLGRAFDSSGGYDFTAFGGGKPAPDASWVEKSRMEGVNIVGFIPVVPDFVIELRSLEKVLHLGKPQDRTFRSATDNLKPLQEKMREYQRVGVRLGLLINPKNQQVEIYRSGQEPEILESPTSIDCSEVMPNFVLSMDRIL
jgi:Uma2 family endonuclease